MSSPPSAHAAAHAHAVALAAQAHAQAHAAAAKAAGAPAPAASVAGSSVARAVSIKHAPAHAVPSLPPQQQQRDDELLSSPSSPSSSDDVLSAGTRGTSPAPTSPSPGSPLRVAAAPTPLAAGAAALTPSSRSTIKHAPVAAEPRTAGSGEPRSAARRSAPGTPSMSRSTSLSLGAPLSHPTGSSAAALSAHGLPADAREASTLSTLFAHKPAQSPADEIGQPLFPVAALHSRPVTRPTSPTRSPAVSPAPPRGLLRSPAPPQMPQMANNEEAIFERDIEHRDSAHALTAAEVIDVAVPPVLDDAVEALTEGDPSSFEIVAPASPAPIALSASALSAHNTHGHGHGHGTSSPAFSDSMGPAAGSLAAQLAERFSIDGGSSSAAGTSPPGRRSAAGGAQGHRRPHSDASSISVGAAAAPLPGTSAQAGSGAGMQQVLDSSADALGMAMIPGGLLFGNAATGASTSAGFTAASRSASRGPAPASPPSHAAGAGAGGLSGLSLPDPFRGSSPGPSLAALPDVPLSSAQTQTPQLGLGLGAPVASSASSVSMDGAVMPSASSATVGASLGVLADYALSESGAAVEASPYTQPSHSHGHAHRASQGDASSSAAPAAAGSSSSAAAAASLGGGVQQRTSSAPAAHGWTPTTQSRSVDGVPGHTMPGGLPPTPALLTPGEMPSLPSSSAAGPSSSFAAAEPPASASPAAPKRLSFFSYSDILNDAPGQLLDFDGAVRASRSMDAEAHAHVLPAAHSHQGGGGGAAQGLGLGIAQPQAGSGAERRSSSAAQTARAEASAPRRSGEALR